MATMSRPKARDIYARVEESGREEIERPVWHLASSGLFAGLTMGLSGLGVAAALLALGHGGAAELVAFAFYPIGFIAVILGRAQLFTENTLYPVVLIFEDHRHVLPTVRLWVVVLVANLVGATLFAVLAVKTGALSADFKHELTGLGARAMAGPFWGNFWSGVIAGWIFALVAWLVEASDAAVGRFLVIGALTYLVGLGHFDHAIASATEALSTTISGEASVGHFFSWLAAIVAGNIVGGIVIVTFLNYGQVRSGSGD
jgi:formate/nitrite transporter FocA (FNT family)